jgi:hypothetical protein
MNIVKSSLCMSCVTSRDQHLMSLVGGHRLSSFVSGAKRNHVHGNSPRLNIYCCRLSNVRDLI